MEVKSRYEVISSLEQQKREYIRERDSLNETLIGKQKQLKELERRKSDTITILDREIVDKNEDISNFQKSMEEKKVTINELIKSIDESLVRFNSLKTTNT
jgi:hypothetical protein